MREAPDSVLSAYLSFFLLSCLGFALALGLFGGWVACTLRGPAPRGFCPWDPRGVTTPTGGHRTSICVNECPRHTGDEAGGPSTVPRAGCGGGAPGREVGQGVGVPPLRFLFLEGGTHKALQARTVS